MRKGLKMAVIVAAATLAAGCAPGRPGKVRVLPEKERGNVTAPLPPSRYRSPARLSWRPVLVEEVEVPGRVEGGVFYPARRELVAVSPAGIRVEGRDTRRRGVSAYLKRDGKRETSRLPSRRREPGPGNVPPPMTGEPLVTAVVNGMPLGDALVALAAPAGFKVALAPEVNSSLPVTLEAEKLPLGEALAALLGPYGYKAVLDLGKKEVRVDVRVE